ncbi:MAG: hypothetical protein R8G33_03940 [Gammaproteobacteria bacterium]|nr:hypothetical protein [Gammaproteobacteria bacterium]
MSDTLVIQSHREPLPYSWIEACLSSVKSWADLNNYHYEYIGDELFDYIPQKLLSKTQNQIVIATDLARLKLLQSKLAKQYKVVIWCDADFLIFSPEKFHLPESSYSLGREVWIQIDAKNSNKLVSKTKVHNAFMMFRNTNNFLDFYSETAERLLNLNSGSIPPQFIGPKLLSAIHNIAYCHVLETAGMISPVVIKDIANDGGAALKLFQSKSIKKIAAANLCSSLYKRGEVSENEIEQCIQKISKCIAS